MSPPSSERITLVEVLELTGSFDAFASVVRTAARRLEAEGVRGLLGAQFYITPGTTEVGAIITFADSRQFIDHALMVTGWPEFKALLGVVKPLDVWVYGRLSEDGLSWLRKVNRVSKIFDSHVAGFVR